MKEIWKEVKDYEDYYEISNYGRLRSKDRLIMGRYDLRFAKGKVIKPTKCTNGYMEYQLHKDGRVKSFLAHRLVAKHFIENPYNLPEVNHLDENIENNNIDNLQWCTSKENANYGSRNKKCRECNRKYFKAVVQKDLQGNFIKKYESMGQASKEINGDISAIIRVCKGKQKTCYGYKWEYVK